MRQSLSTLLVLISLGTSVAVASTTPPAALTVLGDVPNRVELSAGDLAKLPRATTIVTDDQGSRVEYSGVAASSVLLHAGAPLGKAMKGPNLALAVIASASDGYTVLFGLAEFDSALGNREILVPDNRNGRPLDQREGPLRLIVKGDARHARWVRKLITLSVLRVR